MKFALIAEGVSEINIIDHIIYYYFKDNDPKVNPLQPPKTSNNKQDGSGGFQEVLKYCKETEKIKTAFIENNYLIIQIDTDKAQEAPLSVSLLDSNSVKKTSEQLYIDVLENLRRILKEEIINEYRERIIFAICIDTIECWLLPIYSRNNKKPHETNCLKKLNKELASKDIHVITGDKNSSNSQRTYGIILSSLKKKNEIEKWSKYNIGFQKFIESLPKIETEEETINTPT